MANPIRQRGLLVLAWFIALLIFNIALHWSENAGQNSLYIFLSASGWLTTPVELVLSAAVVYGILSMGRTKSRDGEAQTLRKQLFSRNALHTVYVLAGMVVVVIVIGLLGAWFTRHGAKDVGNPSAQSKPHDDRAPMNPNALADYALMSKSKADVGTEEDGLAPETKKRMRESLALQLSGGFQKQNNPIRVDVIGDDHDVLIFQLPSFNAELANELVKEFSQGDANFWNAMRLLNFQQVVFSGDAYKRTVAREEFVRYGKDYEKYKAGFLKAAKGLEAGAKGELPKP